MIEDRNLLFLSYRENELYVRVEERCPTDVTVDTAAGVWFYKGDRPIQIGDISPHIFSVREWHGSLSGHPIGVYDRTDASHWQNMLDHQITALELTRFKPCGHCVDE